MSPIGIVSTGSYVPTTVVTNEELAGDAGVTADWIIRKTGIHERRRAADHEATSDLAAHAARGALAQAGLRPEDLSYIVLATSTPDHPQPATASIVQNLIGATNAAAFDVNAVCSGFVYALTVAERLLAGQPGNRYGLVVGVDIYSRILDYSDRKTCILFGDGAGAVVLGPAEEGKGVLETGLITRGDQHRLISVPAGGSRIPPSAESVRAGQHYFRMDGRGVRGFVHENLPAALHQLLDTAGVPADEVQHFIPHQANGVMLSEVWPELGLDNAALHLALKRYGNTGSGSVPITLDLVHRQGLLAENDVVLLTGFGGGMNVGSALLRWGATPYARPARTALPLAG
ncbi:3-oxoacyl-ACP synthase III family protein [Streptomyces vilmorinianum]|uniref:3-oxoacyl-ACP synthase III family protein n=1 Tax=Streptomyces vilmorinianum TaxID=3051092 RepID=UPI001C2F9305|nr:ketoacyl-ACP synthase III [Streptomyces vilmorinianum]